MIQRLFFLFFASLFLFWGEYAFSDLSGGWVCPQLILILVIFCNLVYGIRYAVFVAFVGGVLKDSYSTVFFGIHPLVLTAAAYVGVYLKKQFPNLRQKHNRMLLVFLVVFFYLFAEWVLYSSLQLSPPWTVVKNIIFPQLFFTMLVSEAVLSGLKKCVLKYSV